MRDGKRPGRDLGAGVWAEQADAPGLPGYLPEMPVYVLAERLAVHDSEGLQRYLDEVTPTVEAHGGRYHVVSSEVEVLEGEWRPAALAMFEFPTREATLAWWNSPDYAPLRELREASASYNIVFAPSLAAEALESRASGEATSAGV